MNVPFKFFKVMKKGIRKEFYFKYKIIYISYSNEMMLTKLKES